jgi:hypothetical protein
MASDPDLLSLYRATLYEVQWHVRPFVLRIDEPSAALGDCHRAHGVHCSAFITAWNPRSRPAGDAVNVAAQARLQATLTRDGYQTLPGWGRDPRGAWPAEASLLVLGMTAADARRAARAFAQHAVVVAEADAVPRLMWIDDPAASAQ